MKTWSTKTTGIVSRWIGFPAAMLTVALLLPPLSLSQSPAPVALGSASDFAVLASSEVTNTGATVVTGDLGVSPGTGVTGTPTVTGTIHAGDSVAAQAQLDLTTAYNDAAGRTVGAITVAGNLGGQTLTPGLYTSTSSLEISSGDLTLDALGDANAVFIFQMASTLITTTGRQVILSGAANPANIFWQVGSSATLGTTSVFKGNILALASITLTTGAVLDGRALARTGAVTLDGNTVTIPSGVTAVEAGSTPEGFTLSQNYPNPFNPSTTIQYSIEEAGMVSLKLFNVLGVEIATLVNGRQDAGSYAVRLDAGGNISGITSGVYYYRLETGSVRSTRKMVLLE